MTIIFVLLYVLLLGADILTKYITVNMLKPIGEVCIIKNFFYLTYVENEGMAFGMMEGARWLFVIVTLVVLAVFYRYILRDGRFRKTVGISAVLIAAGATGNLIDRIRTGYVVDFLRFVFFGHSFAVFNFADILITCGTALLCLHILFGERSGNR